MKPEDVCIVTNNCYGLQFYKKNNLQYNTPFSGLFLMAPCFVKFVENFEYYINLTPKPFLDYPSGSKYANVQLDLITVPSKEAVYPIAKLEDIEIHFLHYGEECHSSTNWGAPTIENAIEGWERRKARMRNINDCIIKLCDKDNFTREYGERFLNLKYKNKFLFTVDDYFAGKDNVTIYPSHLRRPGDELEQVYPLETLVEKFTV